jgi:hypothetical protein
VRQDRHLRARAGLVLNVAYGCLARRVAAARPSSARAPRPRSVLGSGPLGECTPPMENSSPQGVQRAIFERRNARSPRVACCGLPKFNPRSSAESATAFAAISKRLAEVRPSERRAVSLEPGSSTAHRTQIACALLYTISSMAKRGDRVALVRAC